MERYPCQYWPRFGPPIGGAQSRFAHAHKATLAGARTITEPTSEPVTEPISEPHGRPFPGTQSRAHVLNVFR